MRWFGLFIAAVLVLALSSVNADVWEEDEHEVLIRNERGTKNREACKYSKGAWSECDPGTNMRSRILSLKKGDPDVCDKSKTIQKKCKKAKHDKKAKTKKHNVNVDHVNASKQKKNDLMMMKQQQQQQPFTNSTISSTSTSLPAACRYERGSWSECNVAGEMTRTDKLKANSDASCEQSRQITKKCKNKKGGKPPKSASKGGRRNRP